MSKAELLVFDMDGTLYQFPGGGTFMQIPFGKTIQQNTQDFIAREFKLDADTAVTKYNQLYEQFDGEMSLGLERDFGIERRRFFDETWSLDPADFVVFEPNIRETLEEVTAERALLSAAPKVWVKRALGHMGIADMFGDNIFTGDPDIRKPSPLAFQQILDACGVEADRAISIGDQEHTDIAPARSLGMRAVRIGLGDTEAEFSAPSVRSAILLLKERGIL